MNGLRTVWREEMNFRIEVSVAVIMVAAGAYLHFSLVEWIILLGCVSAVLSAEILNTTVEDVCNKIQPDLDPVIGKIKDIMAGFVLVVSFTVSVIGILLFVYHFHYDQF